MSVHTIQWSWRCPKCGVMYGRKQKDCVICRAQTTYIPQVKYKPGAIETPSFWRLSGGTTKSPKS